MVINKEIICLAAFLVVGIILVCMLSTRTEGMKMKKKKKKSKSVQAVSALKAGRVEKSPPPPGDILRGIGVSGYSTETYQQGGGGGRLGGGGTK